VIVVLLPAPLTSAAPGDDLVGQTSVIDGDTIEIHGVRIRLWHRRARRRPALRGPDSDFYRCGTRAANELASFVAGARCFTAVDSQRLACWRRLRAWVEINPGAVHRGSNTWHVVHCSLRKTLSEQLSL